ncbi:MAG: hypothetical protein ACXAEU_13345 [Candidatus Hodarchaeales archaeon]
MAESKNKGKEKKKPKYQIITEKITPHITIDFKTGKRDPQDFKALLRRLHDLKELEKSELKYALTNYRLIVLSLGLFHYLPEITENENNLELFLSQIVQILQEKYLSTGKTRTKEEFLNMLITKLKAEIIALPMATVFTGDVTSGFDFLRTQVNDSIEGSFEDLDTVLSLIVPKLIDNLRENMLASGRYSPILYDMAKVSRNMKNGELSDIGTLMGKIDEWEHRYTSPEDFREETIAEEKPSNTGIFREARPELKSTNAVKRKEEASQTRVSYNATSEADLYDVFTTLKRTINTAMGQTTLTVNEILKTKIPKILNDFKESMISQGLMSRLIIYDINTISRKFASGSLTTKDELVEKLVEWENKCRGIG